MTAAETIAYLTTGIEPYPNKLVLLNTREGFFDAFHQACLAEPNMHRADVYDALNDMVVEYFGKSHYVDYRSFAHMEHRYRVSLIEQEGMGVL